jgi:hypothetical protein
VPYLEHKWKFDVAARGGAIFKIEAYRPDNSDNDDFTFAYSIKDKDPMKSRTRAKAIRNPESAKIGRMPNGLYYSVIIRLEADNPSES